MCFLGVITWKQAHIGGFQTFIFPWVLETKVVVVVEPTALKNMRKSKWEAFPKFRGEHKKHLKRPTCFNVGFCLEGNVFFATRFVGNYIPT